MISLKINKCSCTAKIILLGLLTAQALSTIQVYLSNADLHRNLTFIRDVGYLVVPNELIMHRLQEFSPAFLGGLFFTLTVGASLSLLSFAGAWVWLRLLFCNRLVLALLVLIWAGGLIAVNQDGFCLMVSSHFLIIPPVVFLGTLKWGPDRNQQKTWLDGTIHFVAVFLLALLWASQFSTQMFLDIRDNLLLSNSLGKRVNDFYYEYTFYPAEVFKSLDNKILKTCNLESVKQVSLTHALEKALRNHDYLNVGGRDPVDLEMAMGGSDLVFRNKERTALRISPQDFFSRPAGVLREFSLKSDRHAFFRQFTFLSLLVGFPLTLYVMFHASVCLVLSFFLNPRSASLISTILCLLFGITLLIPLHLGRAKQTDTKKLAKSLESQCWQERVAALRMVQEKGIDVRTIETYQSMRSSRHVSERYWLARALAVSRQPGAYEDLMAFLNDPSPNVISMAFYALGKRGDKRAVEEIIKRIEASDSWYNQWYAYKALRNLGWKQAKLKQTR